MRKFNLQIVTPDGLLYEGEVESLLVRTADGDAEFLAGHIDYIAPLGTGRARIKIDGKDKFAAVSGGFVTVSQNYVKLVAITFEFAENIDLERALRAKERAIASLASSKDEKALDIARLKLSRAISRINVCELR